jgi:hypothetical protein
LLQKTGPFVGKKTTRLTISSKLVDLFPECFALIHLVPDTFCFFRVRVVGSSTCRVKVQFGAFSTISLVSQLVWSKGFAEFVEL